MGGGAPQLSSANLSINGDAQSPSQSPQTLRFYRLVTLLALMLSDGTYTVLRRYSQGVLREKYSVHEVLLVAEMIKLCFSTYMIAMKKRCHCRSPTSTDSHNDSHGHSHGDYYAADDLSLHLFNLLLNSQKMLILAVTYGLGNLLSYYALARVGAGTFVVIANLKTLTTAGFSILMLGRSYSWTRWRALILLVAGVVLFVLPTLEEEEGDVAAAAIGNSNNLGDEEEGLPETLLLTSKNLSTATLSKNGIFMGCLAELIVITLSGFASIYLEKAIKNEALDLWERNFQLGFYSIFMYSFLIAIIYPKTPGDDESFYFANWTPLAVVLSCLGTCGGLLVALSIKYGDSVLKTLAISGSIIYASVVDHVLLGGPLTGQMSISAVVVIIAVTNYTFDETPSAATAADDNKSSARSIVAKPT